MKLIAVIYVTLLLIVTNRAQRCTPIQGCDVRIDGSCYAHVDDNINWNEAEECCVAWGGHLASIHSNNENIILNDIRNQDRFTWIGMSDRVNDGMNWADGTPYDYDEFKMRQRDREGRESCVHFIDKLKWNDDDCSINSLGNVSTSYICQESKFSFP